MHETFCKFDLNKLIDSARGISQYIITDGKREKLITVIGELHKQDFKCKGDSLSIYEYCNLRVSQNSKCMCLLEYNDNCDYDISRIGSTIIQEVFTSTNNIRTKTIGIDSRTDFLSALTQNRLYNTDMDLEKIDIYKEYLHPFVSNKKTIDCNKFLKKYMNRIDEKFETCIKEHKSGNIDVSNLKWAWLMVMDYNILDQILKNEEYDEYVVVVGENHRINIHNVLTEFLKDIVTVIKNESKVTGKCVSTNKLKKKC